MKRILCVILFAFILAVQIAAQSNPPLTVTDGTVSKANPSTLVFPPASLAINGGTVTYTGGGGGPGVTSVSVVTANGVSGLVATATTTPAITLTLGAITPLTVNGNTITTGTGTLTLGAGKTLTVNDTLIAAGVDFANTFTENNIFSNDLTIGGNLNLNGSIITVGTAMGLRTGVNAADRVRLQVFDTGLGSHISAATMTANNPATFDLADFTTKAGQYIYRGGGTDVAIADGGTGQSTASAGFNALAPSKTANALKVLRVNAGETDYELATISDSGDVVGPASATDNAIVRYDGTTGKLIQDSLGVTIDDSDRFFANASSVLNSGTQRAGYFLLTSTPTSNATGRRFGARLESNTAASAFNFVTVGAIDADVAFNSTGTVTSLESYSGTTYNASGSVVGTLDGLKQFIQSDTGTVTVARGLYTHFDINGGTAVDSFGAYLSNPTGAGSVTNSYGLYIESQTKGGTLNRSIYVAGGTSEFVGNILIGGGVSASELRFLEPSGSGTNYSAFKAVAQGATITYSLPPTVGAAGTILTDVAGDGVLSWAAAGGGSPGGSGTELQFRGGASTFSAVTGSSVSGGNVALAGNLDLNVNGSPSVGNANFGGNAIQFKNNGNINFFAGTGIADILTSNQTFESTSNYQKLISLSPTVNQGGTAGYAAIFVNVTESGMGSGEKNFVEFQVGGSTKYKVTNTGWQRWAGECFVASDQANATVTPQSSTCSITVITGKKYSFKFIGYLSDSVAADGAAIDFDGGSATATNFRTQCTAFDTALNLSTQVTALATDIAATTFTGNGMFECHGSFEPSGSGTFIPRFFQNAHTTGTLTLLRGSHMVMFDQP